MFRPQIKSFAAAGTHLNVMSIVCRFWVVVPVIVQSVWVLFDPYGVITETAVNDPAAKYALAHWYPPLPLRRLASVCLAELERGPLATRSTMKELLAQYMAYSC